MSMSSFQENLNQSLTRWSKDHGFSHWGASPLANPLSIEFYRQWIEQNYQGEMEYLKRHLPEKENPKLINERLESALVFAHPYVPHPKAQNEDSNLRTALYARGEDYHFWLKEKLEQMAQGLRLQFPDEIFICLSDSSPIMERDLAYRAGLGWVGKNTCVIHPQFGSLFLIGEIVTSLKLETKTELVQDFCGTCTRCMDICPTKAIEAPRLLNAQKCISYLTIESRQIPSADLRPQIQDWFFGCDLCQTVCPWNEKAFRTQLHLPKESLEAKTKRSLSPEMREQLVSELRDLLTLSGKKIEKKYHGSPLKRAGPFGLRRNAIIVATNHQLIELRSEISSWQKDEKLKELVLWSLEQMPSTI